MASLNAFKHVCLDVTIFHSLRKQVQIIKQLIRQSYLKTRYHWNEELHKKVQNLDTCASNNTSRINITIEAQCKVLYCKFNLPILELSSGEVGVTSGEGVTHPRPSNPHSGLSAGMLLSFGHRTLFMSILRRKSSWLNVISPTWEA